MQTLPMQTLPKFTAALAILWFFAMAPAAAQTLTERAAPCLACHGEKGVSETPDIP